MRIQRNQALGEKLPSQIPNELLPSAISKVFGLMGIAEEEIIRAKAEHPATAHQRLQASFGLLIPPEALGRLDERVYRAHARELLARVARNEDTRPGTKAEVMVFIGTATLKSRLLRDLESLYGKLFTEVFGETEFSVGFTEETHPGAHDEWLREISRTLAVDERVMR